MSIKCVSRKIFKLTIEHVIERQEANLIPGERPFKKARLQFITDLLSAGSFYRADFAYAKCDEDGKTYGINGKHTGNCLYACHTNNEMPDFPEGIPLCVERFECDTIDELSTLFDNFDNPQSNRTAGEKLGTQIAKSYEKLDGIDEVVIRNALKGVNYSRSMKRNPDEPKVKNWDLGELLQDNEICDFCSFIQGFKDDSWKGWKVASVCAVMYSSWRENEDASQLIWGEALNESNDSESSDSRKFVNKMRTESGRKVKSHDWFYNESMRYWRRHRKEVAVTS